MANGIKQQAMDLYEAAHKNLPGKVIRQFNGLQEDVRFLESREGMNAIAMLHTEGITDYLQR